MVKRISLFQVANITILFIVALITIMPIYYVFAVSFTDPAEFLKQSIILFPGQLSLASYKYLLLNRAFVHSVGVSAFLSTVGTACSLMVTAALSYALSRKRLRARQLLLILILFTVIFNPGMIPNYLLVRQLGLINRIWSLILPQLASGWYVILMKGFFDSIPDSLEEAAAIDGCNDLTTYVRIVLPLSLPALAAFGLFYAVEYWNVFFNALLYLNDSSKWPIQLLLQNMLNDSASTLADADPLVQPPPSDTLKMAAVVIASVPIMCVYPFLQKHFAKGVMLGSVKG